jgi:hypothetical protein
MVYRALRGAQDVPQSEDQGFGRATMAEQRDAHTCEQCGVGGPLVVFGDEGAYRYHCLRCWKDAAEWVAAEYTLQVDEPVPDA